MLGHKKAFHDPCLLVQATNGKHVTHGLNGFMAKVVCQCNIGKRLMGPSHIQKPPTQNFILEYPLQSLRGFVSMYAFRGGGNLQSKSIATNKAIKQSESNNQHLRGCTSRGFDCAMKLPPI